MQNQISNNWQKDSLENLLDTLIDHRGITPKKLGGDWSANGIPVLSAKNIKTGKIVDEQNIRFVSQKLYEKWMPEKLEDGDILLTSEAPLGELYFLKGKKDYVLSQRLFALRTNRKRLNPRYLYYYLQGSIGRQELLRRLSGTAAEGIRQAELRKINVEFPQDILQQEKIVSIISAFDDKIEINNKIAKTLEEIAQTLFKEWFINFKFPGYEKEEFVDNDIGKIPKEWDVKTLEKVCLKLGSGGTPSTRNEDYYEGNISWFSTKELQDDFLIESEKKISEEGLNNSSAKIFPKETVVMAIYAAPTVGRLGILSHDSAFNQAACGFYANPEIISNEFIYLYLLSSRAKLNNLASGVAQQNLNVGIMKDFQLIIPDKKLLDEFNNIIKPSFNKQLEISLENQKLAALRDLLLPKLMKGEIRI